MTLKLVSIIYFVVLHDLIINDLIVFAPIKTGITRGNIVSHLINKSIHKKLIKNFYDTQLTASVFSKQK